MLKVFAYAKLDLGIHVNPKKKADGYFPVNYIDCQIDLRDKLFLEKKKDEIEVVCFDPEVPNGSENFVYRAAVMLRDMAGKKGLGARIKLVKGIPVKAGFGGGSSDAAAAVLGLSKLWGAKITKVQLKQLAAVLGKDFYYSLQGKLCEVVGEGRSWEVTPIAGVLPQFWLMVLIPFEEKPSTGWVYEHLKAKKIGRNSGKIAKLKEAIVKGGKGQILANLTNDFEADVGTHFKVVGQMKEDLAQAGALSAIMAGAGLSVVGFFESQKDAEAAKGKLKGSYKSVFISKIIR